MDHGGGGGPHQSPSRGDILCSLVTSEHQPPPLFLSCYRSEMWSFLKPTGAAGAPCLLSSVATPSSPPHMADVAISKCPVALTRDRQLNTTVKHRQTEGYSPNLSPTAVRQQPCVGFRRWPPTLRSCAISSQLSTCNFLLPLAVSSPIIRVQLGCL